MAPRLCLGLLALFGIPPLVAADPPGTPPDGTVPALEARPQTHSEHPEAEPFTPKPPSEQEAPEVEIKPEAELLPCHRYWMTGEYLLWRIRDSNPPVLVSTGQPVGPSPGALGNSGGVAGNTTTIPLSGGANLENNYRSGARLFLGGWFDDQEQLGAEAGYFFLASRNTNFAAGGDGSLTSPVIARPFFNAATGQQDASLVNYPAIGSNLPQDLVIAGSVHVGLSSQMQGAEINGTYALFKTRGFCLDGLAGVRYVFLRELLDVNENDQVGPSAGVLINTTINVHDHFGATNNFYGGQVGLKASLRHDSWEIDLIGKFAAGAMDQSVDINGSTQFIPLNGSSQVVPGGLLALSSNSGHYQRDVFTIVPEVTVQLRYHITTWLDATVGYSLIYLGSTVRPDQEVDTTINPGLVPTSLSHGVVSGQVGPVFAFHGTDFYAQGLNLGLTFQY